MHELFRAHAFRTRYTYTYIAVLVLGEVRREHAFITRYTYMYSVLILAVAIPKCVVHTLLERDIHTHI